ncbi:MAG: protease family protein [Verrucomicrobiota bacterium]|jgi:membrane protease YdiL (CAAX protease family)
MAFDGVVPLFSAAIYVLFLIAAVYIYVSLLRQIRARAVEPAAVPIRDFGWPEAILAALLACWFLLNILASHSHNVTSMRNRDLVASAVFTIGLLFFIAAFLYFRGLNLSSLGGFSKIGFGRAVATGAVLMLAAYPLILLAEAVTQTFLRGVPEKQGIVELFTASSTLEQRILIILLAVTVAPIAEEFFFRFFLYGVMKRYFGYGVGLVVNALLFAAVHAHLPSFAPLFILGICFTIAYEWTGSILVSMTMHALFNALALTALAFPEIFPQ